MNSPIWSRHKRFAVLFIFIAIFSGCGDELPSSDTDSSSSTVDNPEVGVVQETAFYVRLYDDGKLPYYMSKLGDFSTNCSIAAGQTGQALDCVLDVNELDLYYNGISLQYNVPSTMCNYVQFSTYWYYNFEVGTGPSTIVINQTKDVDGNLLSNSCVIDGTTEADCEGTEAIYSAATDTLSCVYDHTPSDGPNCCLGNYTKTHNITVSGGSATTSITTGTWGGSKVSACIGGPGKTDWQSYNKSGYPTGVIYYTPSIGLNEKYQITAPIKSTNSGSNFPIANFYTSSKHTHTGYNSSRSSSIPFFINPLDDRSQDVLYSGNPAYTWRCLDKNDEVINQIRVYVREWNTYSEFVKYGTTSGASGDPDIGGYEGSTCDYMSSGFECNDLKDLDDKSETVYNSTTKPNNFPKEAF